MKTDIPLDTRINHLNKSLDDHPHDDLVYLYGSCFVCSHRLHDGIFKKCNCGFCNPKLVNITDKLLREEK